MYMHMCVYTEREYKTIYINMFVSVYLSLSLYIYVCIYMHMFNRYPYPWSPYIEKLACTYRFETCLNNTTLNVESE